MRIRKELDGYLLWSPERRREDRLSVSVQELLEIACYVAEHKEELEKEAVEEKDLQLLQATRLAGKRDPDSKLHGGFALIQRDGLYSYHPFRRRTQAEREAAIPVAPFQLIEQWKWDGRTWQAF